MINWARVMGQRGRGCGATAGGREQGVLPGYTAAMLWERRQLWPQHGTLTGNQCSSFKGLGLEATKFHREHDPPGTEAGKTNP